MKVQARFTSPIPDLSKPFTGKPLTRELVLEIGDVTVVIPDKETAQAVLTAVKTSVIFGEWDK